METKQKDIVVIGAGLTGLTLAYYLKKAGKSVAVIEKSDKTGGVITTISENGFTYETGPSTGVLGSIEIVELFEDMQSKCSLEVANQDAKKRYIWKGSRWEALPSGLISAIKTPLFSWYDKFRILGEPFRPKGGYPDEPVAGLVVRRLGKSYLNYAVDPFISGVYAGDPQRLITRHALPKLYALENNYGGFVRGTIGKMKESRKNPDPNKGKVTRDVFSVENGLENLAKALSASIGAENIFVSSSNTIVQPSTGGFTTSFINKSGVQIEIVSTKAVSTIGGYALPELLPFVSKDEMTSLSETTYSPVIHAAVGFKKWDGVKLDAFGGLVPSKENKRILGVLFPSAIFKNRAPEAGAMLSVFIGGIKHPEMLDLSDEQLHKLVDEELRTTMKTKSTPDLIRIFRHKHAIAQYDIKSEARKTAISSIEKQYPGLIIAGSMRDGIGMSDRVKQAKSIAELLV